MNDQIEIWEGIFGLGSWKKKRAKCENGHFKIFSLKNNKNRLKFDLSKIGYKAVTQSYFGFNIYTEYEKYMFRVDSKEKLNKWEEFFQQEALERKKKLEQMKSLIKIK